MKILCQYADTNLGRKFDNATPLFGAACNGHLDVVKELILNNDVNIDQVISNYKPTIFWKEKEKLKMPSEIQKHS